MLAGDGGRTESGEEGEWKGGKQGSYLDFYLVVDVLGHFSWCGWVEMRMEVLETFMRL